MSLLRYACTPEKGLVIADDGEFALYAEAEAVLAQRDARIAELEQSSKMVKRRARDLDLILDTRDAELAQRDARIAELEEALAKANSLIREWSNFDFDCLDEYNAEIHDQLCQKTAKHLKAREGE